MKKYIFYLYTLLIFASFATVFSSCEEIDEGSRGAVSAGTYFADELSLQSGVYGLYSTMHRASWGVDILAAYTGADDLTTHNTGGNKWVFMEGDQFALTDGNPRTGGIWSGYYRVIYDCNWLLENANPAGVDEAVINNTHANARFIRAMMLFRLTMIFGDIPMPLETTPDYEIEKTPTRQVMAQVIEDFKFAAEHLINPRDEDPTISDGRATKTAAKAYLAKAYMQLTGYPFNESEHWSTVKDYCSQIMNAGVYSLVDNYADNFEYDKQINKEMIMAQMHYRNAWPIKTECRWYGAFWRNWMDMFLEWKYFDERPMGWRSNYTMTDEGEFAEQYSHPVLTKLVYGCVQGQPEYVHTWQSHNDVPVMRYSEVLLMYAEACANTGSAADGYEALNMVRRRAYAGNATTRDEVTALGDDFWKDADAAIDYTTAEGDFVEAVLRERKYEFTAEISGNRWLDLVRLEIVAEANAHRGSDDRELPLVGNPSDKAKWFAPIPGSEVRFNPNLAD